MDYQIIAAHLASALIVAKGEARASLQTSQSAASIFFDCCDAVIAKAEKRDPRNVSKG
jgi:hypothetical protein